MTDADRQAIVAEIAEMTRPPALKPHEATAAMVAEMEDIMPRQASYRLERDWRKGLFHRRKVQVGSHRQWAYSIVAPVTDSVTNGDQDKPGSDELEF